MRASRLFRVREVWVAVAVFTMVANATAGAQPELVVQSGHTAGVNSAAFSPDGKYIVTASYDNTAIVWDAVSGQKLRSLAGNTGSLHSAAFSPDGKYIVTAAAIAAVWDAASGQRLCTLAGHTSYVYSAVYSPDGRHILTASLDKTVVVWDAASGKKLRTLPGDITSMEYSAAYSPDGRYIVTSSYEYDNAAIVWDAASCERLRTLAGHTSGVNSAAYSPDGQHIVTASYDKTAVVWDAASGKKLRTLAGHTSYMISAAYSPDGQHILTASLDKTVVVWDATSGQRLRTLAGSTSGVNSAAYSPDGQHIVTASYDKTAVVWDAASGKKLLTLVGHTDAVRSAAYSPDGRHIVTSSGDTTVVVRDATSGQKLLTLADTASVSSAAYSPDGRHILTASGDKTAAVWDAASGQKLRALTGHTSYVISATYSPDGRHIVTASSDKTAVIWDTASGQKLLTLAGHTDVVRSAAYSPDGRHIVTASSDKTAVIWDTASGQKLLTLAGHTSYVNSAAYSPDGRHIVTASRDETAVVWDAASGKKLRILAANRGIVNSAAYSPDGRHILTSFWVWTDVWDAASGEKLRTLAGHTYDVNSVAYSPDGRQIVTSSADGTIRLWNVPTGQELCLLLSFDAGKEWLAVTPQGLFDGSLGGREKVAFRVGGGLTVVPVDRFFQDFYSPGLLAAIHRGERPMPRNDFAAMAAPTVRFEAPKVDKHTEDDTAEVVVEAVDEGGGVQGPYLYHNGTRLLTATDTRRLGKTTRRSFHVRLVEGTNRLEAKAASGDGGWESEPARLVIAYDRPLVKPDLWMLAVGVNEYADDRIRLRYAGADARGFGDLFDRRGKGLYAAVHVTTLLDAKATRAGIGDALDAIAAQAQPRDTLVLTVSGHGTTLGQRYYFLPHEFRTDTYPTLEENVKKQGIPIDELGERLSKVPALRKVLILDTCGSGGATGLLQKGRNPFAFRGAIERMNRTQGMFTIAACAAGEEAQEAKDLGHGLLSYALLAGLRSVDGGPLEERGLQPSNVDQVADVLEWFSFAAGQAPGLSKRYFGREQDVHMATSGNSFPLLPLRDQ